MLSENMKTLRTEQGLSQEELATRLSVVRQTVSKWEKGLSQPDAAMLVALAQELGVSVSDLLGETIATPVADAPEQKKPRGNALKTMLIIFGFPIWFSLLIAAFSVVLSLYISAWAVVISLWAAFGSLAVGLPAGVLLGVWFAVSGHGLTGLAAVAAGLVCAGFSILLFFGCLALTKCCVRLSQWMARVTKGMLGKKEVAE